MIKDSITYTKATSYADSIVPHDVISSGMRRMEDSGISDSIPRNTTNIEVADVGHDGIVLPFSIEQADGVFALLLLCFLFFTHVYNGGITFFKENIGLLFSYEKNRRQHWQITMKEVIYSYFLMFQAIVLMSIAAYAILLEYEPNSQGGSRPLVTILSFMALFALFFVLKDLFFRFLGYAFEAGRSLGMWRKIQVTAVEILGILYFIPTLLLVYTDVYHFQIAIFIVILFLIVQIILFYQVILFFIREKLNFLYLIAYLCAFEILPYIFLAIGLVYLYRIDVF